MDPDVAEEGGHAKVSARGTSPIRFHTIIYINLFCHIFSWCFDAHAKLVKAYISEQLNLFFMMGIFGVLP